MRYYFDIRYGDTINPDEEGMDFLSLGDVQEEAARSLADTLRYPESCEGGDGAAHSISIEVRDENGPVLEVRYRFERDGQRH
jgi:hypothetical protein